jgi:hypothetical protein
MKVTTNANQANDIAGGIATNTSTIIIGKSNNALVIDTVVILPR